MAAPRSTSYRALSQLRSPAHQVRSLHITPAAWYPSRVLSDKPKPSHRSRGSAGSDLASLRAECSSQSLPTAGSKEELTQRLALHSRGFTTTPASAPVAPHSRGFNTSRALKAPNDSSTIDFAFLPMDMLRTVVVEPPPRVPILPHVYRASPKPGALAEERVVGAELGQLIHTLAGDGTHVESPSAMSEGVDAEQRKEAIGGSTRREVGMVKQLWEGFVDDVLGKKGGDGVGRPAV